MRPRPRRRTPGRLSCSRGADAFEWTGSVTPLADAILRILEGESAYPPKSTATMIKILKHTGWPHGPAGLPEVEAAFGELFAAHLAERIWRRGGARYRVSHNVQVGNVKAC